MMMTPDHSVPESESRRAELAAFLAMSALLQKGAAAAGEKTTKRNASVLEPSLWTHQGLRRALWLHDAAPQHSPARRPPRASRMFSHDHEDLSSEIAGSRTCCPHCGACNKKCG